MQRLSETKWAFLEHEPRHHISELQWAHSSIQSGQQCTNTYMLGPVKKFSHYGVPENQTIFKSLSTLIGSLSIIEKECMNFLAVEILL